MFQLFLLEGLKSWLLKFIHFNITFKMRLIFKLFQIDRSIDILSHILYFIFAIDLLNEEIFLTRL